jgi:SulP family sulfate permease
VTLLNVVGSVFFAGARSLEELLPSPAESESPVVILRLRGQQRIGSTFLNVVDNYSDKLEKVGASSI